ncbi:TonB family C-terminal domain-containing protein [Reichenbachiella agariperforans]|uniref:TonB family C-terminal domain-containing protein n=1 Tax=Reichenbachiella agariperforans TaxID=156994 RepID=A0A1M6NZF1_REIAG|nr:M56 family metallopeptidase [Reichenbachiella agariperforans]SHK01066.1 TonB family C-terminal domain-containing protein [Reichenbachiella agariperforans]
MKIALINYLLEANFILITTGIIYYVFLHKEHSFQLKRVYILMSTLAAWGLPFVRLNYDNNTEPALADTIPILHLPPIQIGESQHIVNSISSIDVGLSLYVIVSCITLGAFLYQLLKIIQLSFHAKRLNEYPNSAVFMTELHPSFSFFRLIFINKSEVEDSNDKHQIIAHEKVHSQQWHSLDMMILYLTRAVFWFNPIIWLYKNSQQETHEYLVDQEIIKREDKSSYQQLLAQMTIRTIYASGNYFAKSQTIKRINMMNEKLKKTHWLKTSTAIAGFTLLSLMVACNDDLINVVDSAEMVADIPENAQMELDRLRAEYPDQKFNYIQVDAPSKSIDMDQIGIDPNTVQWMDVNKNENKVGLILVANDDFAQLVEHKKVADDVFDIVEDQPTPSGGMKAFYEYIGINLKYPIAAREAGVEGIVFVQFVIDTEGNVTEAKVVKGIGSGCDAEALRVIRNSPKWKPGMQRGKAVNVRMILPITYSLGNPATEESLDIKVEKIDENVEVDERKK